MSSEPSAAPSLPHRHSHAARPLAAPSSDSPAGRRRCCSGSEPAKSKDPAPRDSGSRKVPGVKRRATGVEEARGGRGRESKRQGEEEMRGQRTTQGVKVSALPGLLHPAWASSCPAAGLPLLLGEQSSAGKSEAGWGGHL